LTLPLTDPAILASGIREVLRRSSPVYVPPTASPRLLKFLLQFARNSTPARFRAALRLYLEVNRQALAAYERLDAAGPAETTRAADPFVAAFASEADRQVLVEEFRHVTELGGTLRYDLATGEQIRAIEPALGPAVNCGIVLHGQRYLNPGRYVRALAAAVRRRGGEIREDARVVSAATDTPGGVLLTLDTGETVRGEAAVLANGAWLSRLARPFGVKTIVQAGRGYSFTVQPDKMPTNPIYFPAQRVACTPLGGTTGGFRIAGMMEFKRPEAALDPRRIQAIVQATRPLLTGIDWAARTDEWVGSRPCTPDGLPLLGRTRARDIYIAGGHGMWGIALGPLSGRLLADQIVHDHTDPIMTAFDPLR
jgi:D-amino-acid dehydrogenase